MLNQITPLIRTYNEAPNIGRTLGRLKWAEDIVVVDNFSSDETLSIARRFAQVRIFQRKFDSLANQFNFGLQEAKIQSEWVLALDADYILTDELIEELRTLRPDLGVNGYRCRFIYCVFGKPLRSSLYPSKTILFRRTHGQWQQRGHHEHLRISGHVVDFHAPVLHDDRKPLRRWFKFQNDYAKLEAKKITCSDRASLDWPDRIRRFWFLAPLGVLSYCLFVKGLIRDGWRGIFYTFQRVYAEFLLSLRLIEYHFFRRARRPQL